MPNHPRPRSTKALIAPDKQAEVQKTIDENPDIDSMDEQARGEIIDITARRINVLADGTKPWGRKARNNDPNNPNLNTDGMTFLRPDGLFEIYDCISGIDGNATWDGYGPFAQGENGYWWPPNPVEGDTGGGDSLQAQIDALADRVAVLEDYAADIDQRMDALEAYASGPFHCHGPVDLPIVLESLTSLRAKGDISVAVKPGEAAPPEESAADGAPALVDLTVLKRVLDRVRGRGEDGAP